MRAVAEAAGVSKSVAQRALAGKAGVADRTRELVLKTALELGYRPDPALAKIAAARWRSATVQSGTTIAWLVDDPPAERAEWRSIEALTDAVEREAGARGYRVETFVSRRQSPTRLAQIFRARGIRIVLVGDVNDAEVLQGFPWHEFACVAVGLGTYRPPIPVVMRGIFDSVHEIWRRLVPLGYRRIGCALFWGDHVAHNRLTHGAVLLEQETQPAGMARLPALFLQKDLREELERYLDEHRPDVLLMPNTGMCVAFEEWGLQRRYACAVVSMKLYRPSTRWAGFDFNAAGIVRQSLSLAHALALAGGRGPPEPTITFVQNEWQDGPSLPAKAPVGAP